MNKRNLLFEYFLSLLIIISIGLLATTISPDFDSYKEIVENITNYNGMGTDNIELGLIYLTKLLNIFFNTEAIIFIIASASVGIKIDILKKITNNYLSVILYILIFSFFLDAIVLRAGLAAALGILAYFLLCQGKYFFMLLSLTISILFHNSAFIYIIAFSLYYLLRNKTELFSRIFLTISFVLLFSNFDISFIFNIIDISTDSKITHYMGDENNLKSRSILAYIYFSFFFLISIFNDYRFRRIILNSREVIFYETAHFFSTIALVVYSSLIYYNATLANRFSDLLLLFIVIPMSLGFRTRKNGLNILFILASSLLFISYGATRFYYLYFVTGVD
jgi:hypothetical protein